LGRDRFDAVGALEKQGIDDLIVLEEAEALLDPVLPFVGAQDLLGAVVILALAGLPAFLRLVDRTADRVVCLRSRDDPLRLGELDSGRGGTLRRGPVSGRLCALQGPPCGIPLQMLSPIGDAAQ